MNEKKIILLLFLFAFAVFSFFSFAEQGKWWDETVYASLGWNLSSNPFHYGFGKFYDRNFDWIESAGYKAPLLPYIIAIVYFVFGWNEFALNFLMPFIGALGVLIVYWLGKTFYNKRIGLIAAVLLALLPFFAYFSGRLLTDILATVLVSATVLCFWKGFEEGKESFKLLSGILLGFAFLARYAAGFIVIPLALFLVWKHKGISFLKDKWFWLAITLMLAVLLPWFFYNFAEYESAFGALEHLQKAAGYWGGEQTIWFFFEHWIEMFALTGIAFIAGMLIAVRKFDRKALLLLSWFFVFLIAGMIVLHKEGRFILPLTPVIALFAALAVDKLKNYKIAVLLVLVLFSLGIIAPQVATMHLKEKSISENCFNEAMNEIKEFEENALIFTDASPVVYYYTHKETTMTASLNSAEKESKSYYILWASINDARETDFKLLAQRNDLRLVFSCPVDGNAESKIYKIE